MPKYVKKEFVSVEKYKPGMEDGFYCVNRMGETATYHKSDEDQIDINRWILRLPYVYSEGNWSIISEEDCILTFENDRKIVMTSDEFNRNYMLVPD